ncbi:MAG: hypothetical protein AUJ97_06120 [Bacteroidetes bacterium CG2_30_32_10]|nr:MAG: hypothetical protein AUJ97_06120 [Bacteroidetes bacterium CG2_30_32_10]
MKINIIGAGVSGLSAGCYLQMNGFETQIFEKNATSGGLCTSWKRGDYTFDGCLHWLMGSNKYSPFYKLWCELIDMQSVDFVNHQTKIDFELKQHTDKYGGKVFHLYTDIKQLEDYLIEHAPEDARTIKKFTQSIREIQKYSLPPLVDKIPGYRSIKDYAIYIKYLPFVFLYLKWRKVTNYSFAKRLKNPFIKEAFELLFDGENLKLILISVPLAFCDNKCAGYPIGGSYLFAKKMEEKYVSLGGKINFSNAVEKIITENGIAKGLLLGNGTKDFSEITISAADWHYTVFEALDGKFLDKKIVELRSQKKLRVFYSMVLISLGISRSFKDEPHLFRFPLEHELVSPDGTIYNRIEVHFYNYDPHLTSEGKTVVSVSFCTRNSDYWIAMRSNDKENYLKNKETFAEEVIGILENKFGNIKQYIEVIDIATPATYYRYTNNWKGSVQGWLPEQDLMAASPIAYQLPGLKQFYFASHWSVPGGGLPIAIKTARDVAQIICKKHHQDFKTE